MKSKSPTAVDQRPSPLQIPWMTVGIGLALLTCAGIKRLQVPTVIGSETEAPAAITAEPVSAPGPSEERVHIPAPASRAVRPILPSTPAPAQPSRVGSTAYAQQLLSALTEFKGGESDSLQSAEQLKQSFKQLAEQGAAAVPAIRQYLDRFQDRDFAPGIGKQLGYSSLRIGLLDVLAQVGGPEAGELLQQTLQNTGDPKEIACLAKGLEKQLPLEQLRTLALTAASEVLKQSLSERRTTGGIEPLFEVLQKYGDPSVVGLLEQSVGKWNYYPTLALAGMADGAGIAALVRLAQDPELQASGNGDFALRPLAQAAMEYPEARAALVEQARLNQIPETAWPGVAASLAGTYIQYGNQIFGRTIPEVVWSQDQINVRLALLEQMLAVTPNSAGRQALQNARATVLSRMPPR